MERQRLIRSATLSGYITAAQQVGLDAGAMLGKVALTIEHLAQPDLPIPFDSFVRLLQISADASGHSDFGARASIARGTPDLGPVSLLIREDETVLDMLHTMMSCIHLHADGMILMLDNEFDAPFLSFRIATDEKISAVQATEFSACGLVQNIRWLVGPDWKPESVCFSHSKSGPTRVHEQFFRAPVLYNQIASGLALDLSSLRTKVRHSPPSLRKQVRQLLEPAIARADGFSWRVVRLIVQMLANGECSADLIATHLGIDRRTLSRRLAQEGNSYSALLQEVRREIALQQIANDHSVTDVTLATGFESLSGFCRWFRSTFGQSASDWRDRDAGGNGRAARRRNYA